jgi:hypothetical protein
MLKISTLIVNAMLLSSFVQFPIPLVEGKISAHHLRMQLPGLTIEADEFSIKLTGNLSPLIVNQAGGRAGGIHHPAEVVEPGVRGRGKEEKEMRGQGMPRRGGKQFGYLRKNGPSCGPGSAREVVLDPGEVALLGDQTGDGGGGVGHLEGSAEGAREGRQLGRLQSPDAILQGRNCGWIEG